MFVSNNVLLPQEVFMQTNPPNPMTAFQVLDTYFLETRARLLEIAANLDRMDRAPTSPPSAAIHG